MCVRPAPEAVWYEMVFASRQPRAVPFRRWVLDEVIPSALLHGRYPPPAWPAALAAEVREKLRELLAVLAANADGGSAWPAARSSFTSKTR